jgi:hypothetical protein|tara:strand:+ start:141 stop:1055 length:915 start_codon:yes stop_codon:yes gene_type:complete
MIAQAKKLQDKILDIKYGRVKEGLKIGIPEIDEFLRYKQGNFNLIIGHANVGKTTVIIYLFVLWAIKHNLKFLIWSSENTPESILRKIIEFKMGTPIQKASDTQIENAVNWANNHFKIIDVDELYTYKNLLKESNQIKDAWNYDALLIDPYNSLSKDPTLQKLTGNSHDYDYQVASEFRLFAKKRNTTIYLNAHGVTSALRNIHHSGHEYEGLPKPLSIGDVEGGGKWGNRADDTICIFRYTGSKTDWMYSNISVLKVKENETGGRPTPHEEPIKLKMKVNNVGFEYLGKDLIHNTQPVQKLNV